MTSLYGCAACDAPSQVHCDCAEKPTNQTHEDVKYDPWGWKESPNKKSIASGEDVGMEGTN